MPPHISRPTGSADDRALREAGDRYRQLVEYSPDAILVHVSGRYVFANPAAVRLFGAGSRDELVGREVLDLVHPDCRDLVTRRIEQAAAGLVTPVAELAILRSDGSAVNVEVTGGPVEFEGQPAIQVLIRDITERKRAAEALGAALRTAEEAQRTLEALMEYVPAGITIADARGRTIRMVSRHGRELLGRSQENLGVESVVRQWPVLHADGVTPMADDDLPLMRAINKGEVVKDCELVQVDAAGRPLSLLCHAAPIVDAEGRITGAVAAWHDVTARREAQEALRNSERLYRAIGESIDYGVWVCAPDGRNIYASESFLRLVGMTQEQCSNFGWGDVLHPDDAERTIEAWKACVSSEGNWDIEHRFRGVDGAWHPILARGVPVRNERGDIICWAGINLDIARLKEAETAVRESDRRKTEFLATLSHELRNPLAPIRFALDLLGPKDLDDSAPERVIERQVLHLVRLVDDLLDLTRIASNKVELRRERIELTPVIRQAVEAATPAIRSAGLTLTVETPAEPVWLDADRERLAQVFANLLNNAARYTPSGGRVTVTTRLEGDQAAVSVADTGIGLAADDLSRVFGMFTQVGRPGRGGLGIGLAIVKGLVELHGGTVEARSAGLGEGSAFIVRLARAEAAVEDSAGGVRPLPEADGCLDILVVDDNVDSADMLKMLLETRGHRVRVAYDGPAALAALAASEFDVGLFDLGLPGITGYDLGLEVRGDPRLAHMRLIAVTGWGQDDDRQRAFAHGFDAHLTKPANPEDLWRLLGFASPRER